MAEGVEPWDILLRRRKYDPVGWHRRNAPNSYPKEANPTGYTTEGLGVLLFGYRHQRGVLGEQ